MSDEEGYELLSEERKDSINRAIAKKWREAREKKRLEEEERKKELEILEQKRLLEEESKKKGGKKGQKAALKVVRLVMVTSLDSSCDWGRIGPNSSTVVLKCSCCSTPLPRARRVW